MRILGGLQLEDAQAPIATGGEQVDQIAIAGSERGDLAVDRLDESGINGGEAGTDGDFETALRSRGKRRTTVFGLSVTGLFQQLKPVAGVAHLNGILEARRIVDVEGAAEVARVEVFEAQGGGDVLVEGKEQRETFDGLMLRSPAAHMVVPDQSERESVVDIRHRRTEQGGPACGSALDDGAWVGGRQRIGQVRARRDLADGPARKLALNRTRELFAVTVTDGADAVVIERGAVGIDQFGAVLASEESAGDEFPVSGGDPRDLAHEQAGGSFGIPGVQPQRSRLLLLHFDLIAPETHRLGARFEQQRFDPKEFFELGQSEHQ